MTPKLHARSDLMHPEERLLRLLPVAAWDCTIHNPAVRISFLLLLRRRVTRARLDCWAGTGTNMRHDCKYVFDCCGLTQELYVVHLEPRSESPGDWLASVYDTCLSNGAQPCWLLGDATISCCAITNEDLPALVQQSLGHCSLHILYQV